MPRDLIIKWAQGEFELVVSTYLLYELQAALSRPNFRKYLTFPVLFQYVMWIADNASVGPDSTGSPRYTGDPGDDYLVTRYRSGSDSRRRQGSARPPGHHPSTRRRPPVLPGHASGVLAPIDPTPPAPPRRRAGPRRSTKRALYKALPTI